MSGRGAGGFPLPPLSPGGGAVAAALGAPPPPAGPGMLPGPALRGPGPAGGVGGPGAAAFRPMGPAGPAAQFQVRRADGRVAPLARPGQGAKGASSEGPGAASWTDGIQGLCMRISRGTVGGKARDPRARLGGGGVGGEGKSYSGV